MERLDPNVHKFLNQLSPLVDGATIYSFELEDFSRKRADGLMTLIIEQDNFKFGIIYNDFKVNGGSFGREVSQRAVKFIEHATEQSFPIVYLLNTIGVRLMEGRVVFQDAFSLVPAIENFKKKNLLITANIGKSLGLGALILSLGHYRYSMSTDKDAEINLTGPEVIKLFFGKTFDFKKHSAPERHLTESGLIHEIYKEKKDLYRQILSQLQFLSISPKALLNRNRTLENIYLLKTPDERVRSLIISLSESHKEIFNQLNPIVRTFLIRRNGKLMGIFINPPGNTNNLITIETLEKYSAALDYFKALKIPIVSFIDTPGASPFNIQDQSKEVINYLGNVALKIINYKFGKSGFVIGRSYGGATLLSFTKNFGAYSSHIVKGSTLGIMHNSIIEKLLENSRRLFLQWKETEKTETQEYTDLIENNVINGVIDYHEISAKLDQFQAYCYGTRSSDLTPTDKIKIEAPAIHAGPLNTLRLNKKKINKKIIRIS